LVFLFLAVSGVSAVTKLDMTRPKIDVDRVKQWAQSEEACNGLRGSFNPMRCKAHADVERDAKLFASKLIISASKLEPVIFVPGFASSGIDGYLERNDVPAFFCWSQWREWFNLWLAFYELLTSTCFLDNMALEFNASTGAFANRLGVQTRPRDFGGFYGIDYVDITDDLFSWSMVFAEMTARFRAVGYVDGVSMWGAPYDWRKPMYSLLSDKESFADSLFALVNHAYAVSGNRSVHVVTHSYGGINVLNFMNRYRPAGMTASQFDAWVQTHVATFIPIAAPFSGTAKSLRAVLSGDTFGAPSFLVNIDTVAALVRQWGGAVQLVPDPDYWPNNVTFVRTPTANYSGAAADLSKLFTAVGAPESLSIFDRTKKDINNLRIPTVPTYCLYGFNHPTEFAYTYDTGLTAHGYTQPTAIDTTNLGDGIVPLQSLLECQYYHEHQGPKDHIRCREYDIAGHEDLQDEHMIYDIIAITTGNRDIIASCETLHLDAAMTALADAKPKKAKDVERAREENRKRRQQN